MKRRAAVITDAVSSNFYFPVWHKYYAKQVGAANVFLLLYGGSACEFASYELGGLWCSHLYNNDTRAKMMSQACDLLLTEYDYVVRVDTDEFLVPDPRIYKSLADYLFRLERPYVTASGYNVIAESTSKSIDFSRDIFKTQRRYCYPYDALNKTCVIGLHTTWSPGFHFASVFPEFNDLSMFHLKYADIDMQIAIGEAVAAQSDEVLFQKYHRTERAAIESNLTSILSFPHHSGWDQFERTEYRAKFLRAIRFTPNWGGVYHGGPFGPERVLLEVPDEFASTL